MTEWRRRNPKRSTTEMGQENQRSCSRALQRQASFIANRGWKSSNSSPLSVGGELFPLTSPFIEQAIALVDPLGAFYAAYAGRIRNDPLQALPTASSFAGQVPSV